VQPPAACRMCRRPSVGQTHPRADAADGNNVLAAFVPLIILRYARIMGDALIRIKKIIQGRNAAWICAAYGMEAGSPGGSHCLAIPRRD
jgi:hypothetical protein